MNIHRTVIPPDRGGTVYPGRTLPSLLDEACELRPNQHALNQYIDRQWQGISLQELRVSADGFALGLLSLGLKKGDRVALFMTSDSQFAIADMGCVSAGLVDVPIELSEAPSAIAYILNHSQAKALIVSTWDLLQQIAEQISTSSDLTAIVVAEQQPCPSTFQSPKPEFQYFALSEITARGTARFSVGKRMQLRSRLDPDDLATIIYVIGSTEHVSDAPLEDWPCSPSTIQRNTIQQQLWERSPKRGPTCDVPRGVALSHANITSSTLSALSSHPDLILGQPEVALSFLPLTHIFARAFLYGHLFYGHTVYFSTPERVNRHLKDVQPTIFLTVPRLLEKAYEQILKTGTQLRGWRRWAYSWALKLADRYEIGQVPRGWYAVELWLASLAVFSQWRQAFGGQVKFLVCGGAALSADLANFFTAAGIPVLQGYGLTETSSVVCYNRDRWNRAGTVGLPIPGVELAIADDGEILVRAPYVMQGYYKDEAATQAVIDTDGWFHTGDMGELTGDGFLQIVGYKKNLFKLSTGKYVSPQPLERYLMHSRLVERAIAIGARRKFCSLAIFPNAEALREWADREGLDEPLEDLLTHPHVLKLYQSLVDEANECMPYWSRAKRFQLIDPELALHCDITRVERRVECSENVEGLNVEGFSAAIEAMYSRPLRNGMLAIAGPLTALAYRAGQLYASLPIHT
ncbi:MAG: long-chain fatty acid--CoA ligase [Synechococcus sp.]